MAIYPKMLPSIYEGHNLLRSGMVSIDEAATYLGVCRQTLYNLMHKGDLPFFVKRGFRGRRIPKVALELFVNSN